MKKLFLFFVLICFLFVGCKTTKNAGETLPPESQTETSDQIEIEQVPPVEESFETEPSLEDVIEEQGDLPLPFYQDFDAELDTEEFTTEDEFFYGDEFVPENKDEIKTEPSVDESFEENVFSENTDVELENEPELVFSDEFIFDDEIPSEDEFLETSTNELETDNENLEKQDDILASETELENESESENQISENLIVENNIESTELTNNISNSTEPKTISSSEKSDLSVDTSELSGTNTDLSSDSKKKEELTKEQIVEIVEDILSKNKTLESNSDLDVDDIESQESVLPSRSVCVNKNQMIIVNYPGTGWVFLGELESLSLVAFRGKTFENDLTSFKLLPQKEGRTVLHFYKLDAISGNYIDDYLEVIVNPNYENSSFTNFVTAPDFSYDMYLLNDKMSLNNSSNDISTDNEELTTEISSEVYLQDNKIELFGLPENQQDDKKINSQNQSKNNKKDFSNSVKEETSSLKNKDLAETEVVEEEPELLFLSDIFDDEDFESEIEDSQLNDDILFDTDLLEKAKTAYENKDYENALSLVNQFLELSNFSVDEALFLKGQILEKPFANRNIREALNCYKKIISSYPQSEFWDKADERIKYIQRFYFNIR